MFNTAVLFDTSSIQQYIFGSNKLKENLGASYIVKHLYDDINNYDIDCKKIYEGGGNNLLLFQNNTEAKDFIAKWSKNLLLKYPGLNVHCTIMDNFNKNNDSFAQDLKKMFRNLSEIKNSDLPINRLLGHGITADCPNTGFSAEVKDKSNGSYISNVSAHKIYNAEKSEKEIEDKYKEILKNIYQFTSNFDELGGTEGENNYIAVVHIDGNDIGNRFKRCKTEDELNNLSESLKDAVENSFTDILKDVILNIEELKEILNIKNNILPVRPIVLGGDDITFVCDARLGIYLALKYMNSFELQNASDNCPLTSCAGVSIVKLKYPFFRAYQIAENLCKNAKKHKKNHSCNKSWIDFNIAYGSINGSLDEIRNKHFVNIENNSLTLRPYKISGDSDSMQNLIKCISKLKKWPNSKIKELREVIFSNSSDREMFVNEMRYRKRSLPKFDEDNNRYDDEIISNNKTPYLDLIEIMDFYPLLKERSNNE